jgi:hypothetical protein
MPIDTTEPRVLRVLTADAFELAKNARSEPGGGRALARETHAVKLGSTRYGSRSWLSGRPSPTSGASATDGMPDMQSVRKKNTK